MAPRKTKKAPEPTWVPPADLRIEVCVSKGDLYFKADTHPSDSLNIARLLTVMALKITDESPDLLPTVHEVPGMVLPFDWAEEYYEGSRKKPRVEPRVGF